MTKENLTVNSKNLLPIIKKWLYTECDIFVRELVSNSCDALYKLKILLDSNEVSANSNEDLRIDVNFDKDRGILEFLDNGIGMTEEEIRKYIAQVAFSSAEEFVNKYSSEKNCDQCIGHFGLGFYSSFMVAERVTIDSLSYKEDSKATFWSCDGSNECEFAKSEKTSRGTSVKLFIGNDHKEFLDKDKVKNILKKYCSFMKFPIFFCGERINPKEPLWIKKVSQCSDEDYKDFYKDIYPLESSPLFWMHINVDYPFTLKGILYFPKFSPENVNKNDNNNIKLYCNRVFVSDGCKDIIPDYLTMLKGVIDSPDIPLNVSRSVLQVDKTVKQLSSHISKKVSDKLISLYNADKKKFLDVWPDIEHVIKLGIMQDEKFFERIQTCLLWKNSKDEWTNLAEYIERNGKESKIFYSSESQKESQCFKMYVDKGFEIIFTESVFDNALINFLEEKKNVTFQRIDADIDDSLIDKERENTILDSEGKTFATKVADFFRKNLDNSEIVVEAKSLPNDALPAVIVLDEKSRRFRDYMRVINGNDGFRENASNNYKLVLNTNNALITSLLKFGKNNSSVAKDVVKEIYELSLVSQKEVQAVDMQHFIFRTFELLNRLIEEANVALIN